jgi:hypothetical protein
MCAVIVRSFRMGLGIVDVIDVVANRPVRYLRIDDKSAATQSLPGGQFTLGGVNSSLFTGAINYIRVSEVKFWTIPMDSVVVNGQEITLPANTSHAMIDTGTTLVGKW